MTWRRISEGFYEHVASGKIVERELVPTNAHFAIWTIQGQKGQFSTRKDAGRWLDEFATNKGG